MSHCSQRWAIGAKKPMFEDGLEWSIWLYPLPAPITPVNWPNQLVCMVSVQDGTPRIIGWHL